MKDVAAAAGVSPTAVSRHVNGRIDLPAQTAERIDGAIRRLNYRPNARARHLATGSTRTLGFITTDIGYPFFAAIASAVEEEVAKSGFSLAVFNSRNQVERELLFLSKIEDGQLDGALFMTNHVDDGTLRDAINHCGKVVVLDEDVPGAKAPRIFVDNEAGGLMATRHLIAQGHRRIAFVSGPEGMTSSRERLSGFRAALAEAGLVVDPDLVCFGVYEETSGAEALQQLWRGPSRPTAILATADLLAIGILRAARAAKIKTPRELSVIGFDDMLHMDLLDPPLTAIRQSIHELGRRGARVLLDLLAGRAETDIAERVPVELILRGSVSPPRLAVGPARLVTLAAGRERR